MKVNDNVLVFGTLAATATVALGGLYLMGRKKKQAKPEPVVESKDQTFQAEGLRCKIKDVN